MVSSTVNEDAIRQVQKSTVIPPPKRTQEDIDKEIAESRKGFYYEQQHEETKKYEFQRASDLDALLKRKQKIASVRCSDDVLGLERGVVDCERGRHSPGSEIHCDSPSQAYSGGHRERGG